MGGQGCVPSEAPAENPFSCHVQLLGARIPSLGARSSICRAAAATRLWLSCLSLTWTLRIHDIGPTWLIQDTRPASGFTYSHLPAPCATSGHMHRLPGFGRRHLLEAVPRSTTLGDFQFVELQTSFLNAFPGLNSVDLTPPEKPVDPSKLGLLGLPRERSLGG